MPTTHILARALIRDAGHVLLVRAEGQPHTFLPGGHVETGEGMVGCLHREMREELGVSVEVGAYRGAVEHRWRRDGTPQYEINHCFAVQAPTLTAPTAPAARESYLTFGWVQCTPEALAAASLQPVPLRRLVPPTEAPSSTWWASTLDPPSPLDDAPAASH